MKMFLIALILLVPATANAQQTEKGRQQAALLDMFFGPNDPIKRPKTVNKYESKVVKTYPTRRWVEDIYQPGLWYYGYYAADETGQWEFRYYRREYKAALNNFNSLYSVYNKYEIRTSNRRPVRVVYEYPY